MWEQALFLLSGTVLNKLYSIENLNYKIYNEFRELWLEESYVKI